MKMQIIPNICNTCRNFMKQCFNILTQNIVAKHSKHQLNQMINFILRNMEKNHMAIMKNNDLIRYCLAKIQRKNSMGKMFGEKN